MALFLIVAFLLIPIAEIAVFIQVGDVIGLGPTLFGIVFTAILGGFLVRRQGFEAIRRSRVSLDRHELPVAELFDGLCILFAGALLLTPGFLTDTLGFLLLVPPLRGILRQYLWAELLKRGTFAHGGATAAGGGNWPRPGRRGGEHVIEGEYTEVTEDEEADRRSLENGALEDGAPEDDRRGPRGHGAGNNPWGRRG